MKNRGRSLAAALACLAVLLLTGCPSKTMMSSFQDITSDADILGSWADVDRQYSSLSVAGLIASPAPGFLHNYSMMRGPMGVVGMTGGDTSYVVTRTILPATGAPDITQIKKLMEEIKFLSVQVVKLRMDEALVDLKTMEADTEEKLQSSIDKIKEALDAKIEAVAEDDQQALDLETVKEERAADIATAQQADETARAALKKELTDATNATIDDLKVKLSKAAALIASLHKGNEEAEKLAKELKYDGTPTTVTSAEAQLAAKELELAALVSQPGILIFRWTAENTSKASTTLAGIAGGSGQSKKGVSGYAIVSGLRTATLYLGSDIHGLWTNVNNIGEIRRWPQVTTMVAQAKKIAYVTELNYEVLRELQADLDAERLSKIAADWKAMLKLSLRASMARVGQLSNTGFMGDMTMAVHRLSDLNSAYFDPGSKERMESLIGTTGGDETAVLSVPREETRTHKQGNYFLPDVQQRTLNKVVNALLQDQGGKSLDETLIQESGPYPYDGWVTFYQVTTSLKTLREMVGQ